MISLGDSLSQYYTILADGEYRCIPFMIQLIFGEVMHNMLSYQHLMSGSGSLKLPHIDVLISCCFDIKPLELSTARQKIQT